MELNNEMSYIIELSALSGNEFQDEVATLFSYNFGDYHFITTLPSGDGGIDGLYAKSSIMIFCYGLKKAELRKTNKQIKDAIIKKFTSDLMRVLELKKTGKGKNVQYSHNPNPQLQGIMRGAEKVTHIKFICNWNEDNSIIGDLRKKFKLLIKKSNKNFVDTNCDCTFLGPKEVVSLCKPTKKNITQLRYPGFVKALSNAQENYETCKNDNTKMDEKFTYLFQNFGQTPKKQEKIAELKERMENFWMRDVVFKQNISVDSKFVSKELEIIRQSVLAELDEEFLDLTKTPKQLLDFYRASVKRKVHEAFPRWDIERVNSIVEMMISSFIGECPLDWRE